MGLRIAVWVQVLVASYLLAVLPVGLDAQENSADPATRPDAESHDRPTPYPRIHFGSAENEAGAGQRARKLRLKSRAYLIDASHAMMSTVTLDSGAETTRLDLMVGELKRSLDSLGKRRDLRFNMVTFGAVQDLAASGELISPGVANIKLAKTWLDRLEVGSNADIYAILKACFEQAPDGAALLVGSLPAMPAGVTGDTIKNNGGVNEFILDMVKQWRGAGIRTSLDIIGIDLPEEARKFYKLLAKAGGGLYLDL